MRKVLNFSIFRLCLIILGILSPEVFAERFFRVDYTVRENETFSLLYKRFVVSNAIINFNTPSVQKTIQENPQVANWKSLVPGTVVKLFIEESKLDERKYLAYEKEMLDKIIVVEKKINIASKAKPSGFKWSLFYMASIGTFTQESNTAAKITFNQSSPFTLGTSFNYFPFERNFSFSTSAYYSTLTASGSNIGSQKVDIPAEIGFNFYYEHRMSQNSYILYAGLDFEKFSTFNMDGIANEEKIYVDESSVSFLTFGYAKLFQFFKKNIYLKTSLSKSVASTYYYQAPENLRSASTIANSSYEGWKALLFLNYKINDRFHLNSLLKYHTMSGPSDLTTLRIGLGFSYVLY